MVARLPRHGGNALLRQLLTAFVFGLWLPMATALMRTAAPAEASLAEATALMATDAPSILARFDQLDKQANQVKKQIQALQNGVLMVQGVAERTATGVSEAIQGMKSVEAVARREARLAKHLQTSFADTGSRVQVAMAEMANMKGSIRTLEDKALRLGMASSSLNAKLINLERDTKELLPGAAGGDLLDTVSKAETDLQQLRVQANSRDVHSMIVAGLASSFKRGQERVEQLAAEESAMGKDVPHDGDVHDGWP
jgi:chromosome segregation ATPase